MHPELEDKLVRQFPQLYQGVNRPVTQSLMCFGFECGDGWFDLLWDLSVKLSSDPHNIPEAVQVKEKFGTLRFYVGSALDEQHELIAEAERISAMVCEQCGNHGQLMTTSPTGSGYGWLKTLCLTDAKKMNYYEIVKD